MSRPQNRSRAAAGASLLTGWLGLAALLAGIGGWAMLTRLSSAVIARGETTPAGHRLIVQHPEGGVIALLAVSEGDSVQAGQVLAQLDGSRLRHEQALTDRRYWERLALRARLLAERDDTPALTPDPALRAAAGADPALAEVVAGQARLLAARRSAERQEDALLAERALQTDARLAGLRAQAAALRRERALLDTDLLGQRALRAKGLTQATLVTRLEREAARLDGQIGALVSARAEMEGKLTELRLERIRLKSQRREAAITALRATTAEIADLAERRRALSERLSRLEIRAPAAGVVQALDLTTPRAVLRPAEALLSIVPQDRPPVITVRIAPRDIDEVHAGQPVHLRLTAFNARTTPDLQARLTRVSADAFRDPATGAAFYRAEIELAPAEAAWLGAPLIPGMPVEVFIATGAQSPAAYLLKPFTDYFARAFRES